MGVLLLSEFMCLCGILHILLDVHFSENERMCITFKALLSCSSYGSYVVQKLGFYCTELKTTDSYDFFWRAPKSDCTLRPYYIHCILNYCLSGVIPLKPEVKIFKEFDSFFAHSMLFFCSFNALFFAHFHLFYNHWGKFPQNEVL